MNTSNRSALKDAICNQAPSYKQINSLDQVVEALIDILLAWGVAASVAYWFVLLFRIQAWCWYPLVVVNISILIYFFRSRFIRPIWPKSKRWVVVLLLACIVSASISAFTNYPDADDFSFSHRAVVAASNLSSPIAMTDTALDVTGLPPISPLHVFTSIEVTTALVAAVFGIPQILAIHMGLGTLVNFMLPAVYFLLLRFFRVRLSYAVLGTVGVLLFLAMSGNLHRDWGYFTVLRSWQGKCILMELIVPLTLLYSLRFHLYGRCADAVRLHAVMCCGIGLSGTALFLVPFVVGISGIAVWGVTKFCRRSAYRVGVSATVLLQPIAVSVLPWLGLLPKFGNVSAWTTGWPLNYYDNLGLVFHSHSIPLYLAYLGIALLMRRRAEFYSFLAYLAVALIMLTAPGVRSLLMGIVTPGAYWRFAYALLVPLWVGLAVVGLIRYIGYPGIRRFIGVACGIALIVFTSIIKTPAINGETISRPGLKFPRGDLAQIYQISNSAEKGSVVLAAPDIVIPLGLLRPDIRFIVTRPDETLLAFTNVGRKDEGSFRDALGTALADCNFSNIPNIRSEQLWPDMSVVVYPSQCGLNRVRALLALGPNWKDVPLAKYHLLVRVNK